MKPFLFSLLVLTSHCLTNVDNFGDVTKLFKKNRAVLLILRNRLDTDRQALMALESLFVNNAPVNSFVELIESECGKLKDFCAAEKLSSEANAVFLLRKFDHQRIALTEDVAELRAQLGIDPFKVTSTESFVKWKSQSKEPALFFNFRSDELSEKVTNTIAKIFSSSLVSVKDFAYKLTDIAGFEKQAELSSDSIVLFANGKTVRFNSDFTAEAVALFVDSEAAELVVPFTLNNYAKVFMTPATHKLFLIRKDEASCPELRSKFEEVSSQHRNEEILSRRAAFIDAVEARTRQAEPQHWGVLQTIFGEDALDGADCRVFALTTRNSRAVKYALRREESGPTVEAFLNDLLDNRLDEPFYKSEKVPVDSKFPGTRVTKVVGKTFKNLILKDGANHSFLLVCAKFDEGCSRLIRFCDLLASKSGGGLEFFFMDAGRNEVPELRAEVFPAFLFYRVGQKFRPEFLTVKFSYENLQNWLDGQLKLVKLPSLRLTKSERLAFVRAIAGEHLKDKKLKNSPIEDEDEENAEL